jgi:hypothetical protein
MASVWIANGAAKPAAARPASTLGGTPKAAKPVGVAIKESVMSVSHRIGTFPYLLGMFAPKRQDHMNSGPFNTNHQVNFLQRVAR